MERGKYLVSIAGCNDCHTPGYFLGKPDMARFLGGSEVGFEIPGLGVFHGPNLTPDKETGLGAWTDAQIATALTTGARPDGRMLAPIMPWHAFANLTPGTYFLRQETFPTGFAPTASLYIGTGGTPSGVTFVEKTGKIALGVRNDGNIDGVQTVSPRLAFNWSVDADRTMQLRGGFGRVRRQRPVERHETSPSARCGTASRSSSIWREPHEHPRDQRVPR